MTSEARKPCTRCKIVAFLIFVAFAVFAGSQVYSHFTGLPTPLDPETVNATVISTPRALPSFHLLDHNNQTFSLAQLQNHWSLVFFGFTDCAGMCPTTMTELSKFMKQLDQHPAKSMPQVVMISVDPERDTVAAMKKYVHSFDSRFIGVTGSADQIDLLTKAMGIVYLKDSHAPDAKDYVIDHSGSIVLLNPKGEIVAFFSFPHDSARLAIDYRTILDHA